MSSRRGAATVAVSGRSMQRIERADLRRLAEIAEADEADLFARTPGAAGRYAGRLLCRALCQGAALHYVTGTNGIKDFDVWSFYVVLPHGPPYPYRRNVPADFGPSKFGRWPGDPVQYVGRRVDLLGRSLPCSISDDPAEVLASYLRGGATASARALARKAAVLIWPDVRVGEIVWPPENAHPG